MQYTGQKDNEGRKFGTNPEQSGKYHTNWLNMMYPRLKLARNLLRDDGVICVSISDIELSNLKSLLNEIFGEENYVNVISVLAKVTAGASGGGEDKRLKKNIEYVVIYAKSLPHLNTLAHLYKYMSLMSVIEAMREAGESWKYTSILSGADERKHIGKIKDGEGNPINIYKRLNVKRTTIRKVCAEEGVSEEEAYAKYLGGIFSDTNAQTSIRTRVIDFIGNLNSNELLEVEYVPRSGKDKGKLVTHSYISNTVRRVIWLSDVAKLKDGKVEKKDRVGTFWDHFDYNNVGKEGGVPFPDGKKPIKLIQQCLDLQQETDGVIVDFFAGSCSSSHAVFAQNLADRGTRRFIAIQLPEAISKQKEYQSVRDFIADIGIKPNVSDLGKERIRRAGEKILLDNADKEGIENLDTGFKVFKLDSSNIKPWDADFDNLEDTLLSHVDNIKSDRSEEDVLYEILLKYGLNLTVPIEERIVHGKIVYIIGFGALIICLDNEITLDVVDGIGALKNELEPEVMRVVFKDGGFKDDVVKTNAIQNLKRFGIDDVKSL